MWQCEMGCCCRGSSDGCLLMGVAVWPVVVARAAANLAGFWEVSAVRAMYGAVSCEGWHPWRGAVSGAGRSEKQLDDGTARLCYHERGQQRYTVSAHSSPVL